MPLWESFRPPQRVLLPMVQCFASRRVPFFASPKKGTKERRPRRGRPFRFATGLPCDARVPHLRKCGRLRNSQGSAEPLLAQTVLGDIPSGRCASRRPQRGPQKQKTKISDRTFPLHTIGFDLPVLGPLKRRRGAELRTGAVGEDCLSKARLHRALRVPQPPGRSEHRRAFRSEAEERCAGVCFSLLTFFCTSKRK
jgi:hypothetical protein